MKTSNRKSVRVEISEKTLARLLTKGQVCEADFRCLDCKAKQCLWRICLNSCVNKMNISDRANKEVMG